MPRIERRTVALVRNLALLSLAIAVAPSGLRKVRTYLRGNAFAGLAKPDSTEPVGIRLEGVRFRHFDGTRLLTFAAADRIDVSRDRNDMTMFGVRDGLYRDGERTFKYQANNAHWNSRRRTLTVSGGVHIKNPDLDLRTQQAKFESRVKRLTATGDIKGNLLKGQFFAHNLVYNIDTEAFAVGPVSWKGKLPEKLVQDAPDEVKQRVWNFKAEETKSDGNKSSIVTHINAIATDGEVYVIAANIVHNRKTDEILATGDEKQPRIQYFSAKANMIASRVQVFRKEKRAVFTGNVIMLVKPKKEQNGKPKIEALPAFQPLVPDQVKADIKGLPKEDAKKKADDLRSTKNIRDFPLVMASAKVEYWYARGSRRAVITGDPQGRQEMVDGQWRHLWSNVGFYDGEKEELKLVSTQGRKDTRMKNSLGDDLIADWMLVSTDEENAERFTGRGLEGDFADVGNDDDPRNDPKQPATPPTGGTTGTTPPATTGGTTGTTGSTTNTTGSTGSTTTTGGAMTGGSAARSKTKPKGSTPSYLLSSGRRRV